MKKSLVLAMAMALGVTASAYAANPFSDVPAGSWAYDAVSKLAAAGVINGFPDGTFGGDKLMTRYEMAQIVAKAMAKGANVDRLAAEFADELDALGVRVAALEKKQDNVKITGQVRYDYTNYGKDIKSMDNAQAGKARAGYRTKLRSRLIFTGDVNKDWKYVALLQNDEDLRSDVADEKTEFQRAYMVGKIGAVGISAGRQNMNLADGNIYDTRYDGVNVYYGKEVKVGAFYGKPTNAYSSWGFDKVYGATLSGKMGALDLAGGWYKFEADATTAKTVYGKLIDDDQIWNVGMSYDYAHGKVGAMLVKSNKDDADGKKTGWVATATYGAAKAAKVGSYGFVAKYYDQPGTTAIQHTMNGFYRYSAGQGYKGYMLAGYLTVARNMVAGVEWYDLKNTAPGLAKDKMQTLWSQLIVTF